MDRRRLLLCGDQSLLNGSFLKDPQQNLTRWMKVDMGSSLTIVEVGEEKVRIEADDLVIWSRHPGETKEAGAELRRLKMQCRQLIICAPFMPHGVKELELYEKWRSFLLLQAQTLHCTLVDAMRTFQDQYEPNYAIWTSPYALSVRGGSLLARLLTHAIGHSTEMYQMWLNNDTTLAYSRL